jgi:hypothetical protein
MAIIAHIIHVQITYMKTNCTLIAGATDKGIDNRARYLSTPKAR